MNRPGPTRQRAIVLASAFFWVLGGAPWARAQGGNGAVEGTVRDSQGGVTPGAIVTVRNEETGITRTTVTQPDGRYRFAALPPGQYELRVELAGFAAVEEKEITLTIGLELRKDFTLSISTVEETVTVTREALVVDQSKSEVTGVVTTQQIETLPINTRQYLNLALLMPGTSQDAARPFYNNVTVGAGTTFYSNGFLVDGVSNTWAEEGEPRQNFPEAAVREFKVNTAQSKAEFGLAAGGVIQVVTKGGTNQTHGEAFEYFRDKSLNALDKFEKERHDQFGDPKPDFRRHQFGASMGGPIVRNRTHYFAAVERTQTKESFTVETGQPQFYSALEGTFARPSHNNLFLARVDHQINPDQTLFVRYAQEHDSIDCNFCGGQVAANGGFDFRKPARSVVAGHTWVVSPQMLNDFRFQYAYAMYQAFPAGGAPFTKPGEYPPDRISPDRIHVGLAFPSLYWGANSDEIGPERRWQFKDAFSLTRSEHDLKFGVDFSHIPFTDDGVSNGTYFFGADQPFNPNDPASVAGLHDAFLFVQTTPPLATSVPTDHLAWFVEDDWKPRSNVTLNLGLRYDRQFGSFNEQLDPNAFPVKIPFIDPKSRGDTNNFGPRVGLAWDLRNDGHSVLRAAYGVYYDNIRTLNNFGEWRNLKQSTIFIPNPRYPDPFLGHNPLDFASTDPQTIYILANNFKNPMAQQYNVGFTQQIARDLSIHVDGVYVYLTHDRIAVDRNLPDPVTGNRPIPEFAQINEDQSIVWSKYRGLYARLDKRFGNRYQFLISSTLAKVRDFASPSSNGGRGFPKVTDQTDYSRDYGPSDTDRRHTLSASGAVTLPAEVTLGVVWIIRSTRPFNSDAGLDLNNDFQVDYVPGTTRNQGNRDLDLALVNGWRAQNGLGPISASQIEQDKFNSVDLRTSKSFRLRGERRLELITQIFNVFGVDNLNAPFSAGQVTNALSDSFGRILTARPRQQAELGVRFIW